jgi:menaquinone-9 beta-reductase
MNLSLENLPKRCDVLVVGSGPAGSAAAMTLARAKRSVVLVDQHAFPRDKVCGDALIPDAHAALQALGVLDQVMKLATDVSHVRCVAPRGSFVDVPGQLAVLPRKQLDYLLCQIAVQAGALMAAPAKFVAPIENNGRVVGAQLRDRHGLQRDIEAGFVVLATGAATQPLLATHMCEQPLPSGMALRGYVQTPLELDATGWAHHLDIVWHRALSPGYGWLFPCGPGLFNIGVGVAQSHHNASSTDQSRKKGNANLRHIFEAFKQIYRPAREVLQQGQLLGDLKGAALRCNLKGARYTRPGLLVTGEAVGSTYSFTGEGIGKALQTGICAAQALLSSVDTTAICQAYETRLNALKPRFELYERANFVNAHPWLLDLLIWRAQKKNNLIKRMSGVLNETSNPGNLVSARGLWSVLKA